jgi:amino acid adenylation domain-containing protein
MSGPPGNAAIVPQAQTIGTRLAAIAERCAERTAIVERDVRLTYRELDASATSIARALAAAAGEDGRVGLFFESKLRALQCAFGAARGGRPYVLLDGADPDPRLRLILDDCAPAALVAEAQLLERARAIAPRGCAVIDAADIRHDRPGAERLASVSPDAPLYLCYTSGSTGRPKGVVQTHRNLLFFADAYAKSLAIRPDDRLSLLYTLSFNAANMDIYGGLLQGATLCAYDLRRSGVHEVAGWLDVERITVLHAVPTLFRELTKRLPPGRVLPHLRAIDLGGEAVFANDVALFRAHTLDGCIFVNQLASTEVGLIAQHVVTHRSPPLAGSIVPAGRPIEGVRVAVLREDGSAADVNEAGELVVCSAHVSPGYWNRPDLDARAFAETAGEPVRRYFSGDFGRVDEEGNLYFLGRRGGRVKVRGHSVDLAEIEAALSASPGVMKCAVVARDNDGGDSSTLIAHAVMRPDVARDHALLRRALSTRLPPYMLPAAFVFADALPLTASGKVDRGALAAIAPAREDSGRPVELPRDEVERTVASLFETLLALAPVGRDDDFFLLGGDSLLGVELQTRLAAAFGVHVGSLHADATVERIAAVVRHAQSNGSRERRALPVLLPLWQQGSEPPLFLVHGRHGQAFVSPHFMQLLGNDQPAWAFQARGLDGLQAPHASIEDMAADYVAEMRKRQPQGPYWIGALCAGTFVAASMAIALRDAGEAVLPLLLLDPPERLLHGGYSQMSEQRFLEKMKTRRAMGRNAGPVDDPAYAKSLVATARAFEQAIAAHRPQPYDGPAYVLSSRQRMSGDAASLRRIFTGPLERFEVGSTHAEALDPRNPVFATCLLRCVALTRDAARAHRSAAVAAPDPVVRS